MTFTIIYDNVCLARHQIRPGYRAGQIWNYDKESSPDKRFPFMAIFLAFQGFFLSKPYRFFYDSS